MKYTITATAMMKYWLLDNFSDDREVGGYAKWERVGNDEIRVVDVRPVRQRSSSTYFEIDSDSHAEFLLGLHEEGEDVAQWSMLFHTHPGDSAAMSGEDVSQLRELAVDCKGDVARSMIVPHDSLSPLMHTAVCVDGIVFFEKSQEITIIDDMNAHSQLSAVGFFDKKSEIGLLPSKTYTSTPGLPANAGKWDDTGGWNEADFWEEKDFPKELAPNYVGDTVTTNKGNQTVIDQYEFEDQVWLVLDDGSVLDLEESTIP